MNTRKSFINKRKSFMNSINCDKIGNTYKSFSSIYR